MSARTLMLSMSILFGFAQVVAGGIVAGRMLGDRHPRNLRRLTVFLVAVWFVASGIAELIVSGLEASRALFHSPDAIQFTAWRARADLLLLLVSIALGGILFIGGTAGVIERVRQRSASGTEEEGQN